MAVEIDAIQSAKSIGWTDALLSRLAANSFGLGGRLSITAPANASALSTTGYSLTGSNASSMIDLSGTWNTSGNPVLIKAAITNTASGGTSKFLSFLAGASGTTEVFSVDKAGYIDVASGNLGTNSTNSGQFFVGASAGWGDWSYLGFRTKGYLAFATGFGQSYSVFLQADAANTLALRNAANAQAFNIYNTYTSGSVYERGFMRWVSNVLEIGTEHTGASVRNIVFKINGTTTCTMSSGGSVSWTNDQTYGSGAELMWSTRGRLRWLADGQLRMTNIAGTDFGMLQWGGITSSFPAIKRSTTFLQARLADDSAFAAFQGKLTTDTAYAAGDPTTTGYIILYDSTGTAYRVPALLHS